MNKSSDEISIILDLSSGYVEGALLQISKTENPYVIFNHRVSLPAGEEKDIERTKVLMWSALQEVLKSLEDEGLSHLKFTKHGRETIQHVYCVLSSPWYISQTKIIKIEKEKPVTITSALLNRIVEDEKNVFKESLLKGEYSQNFKESVEVLESKIIRMKLNGYETWQPTGQSVKNIEVSIYLSFAGVELTEKIKETIRRNFNVKSIQFHSFPLVLFSGVRDLKDTPPDFLLVDVREEVTDVSLIKKGLLLETVTIPIGSSFYIREIGQSLNTVPQVALSFLRLYQAQKAEPNVTEKIREILNSKKDWVTHFHESLRSFFEEFFLPKTLFITADSDFIALFSKMIEDEIFEQFAGDREPFKIVPIQDSLIKDSYKIGEFAENASLLAMESVFIQKLGERAI
ncbi:MAG: hypothetical protein ABI430_01765 [Candidatus Taylorbacteria bacterium]